MFTVLYEKCFPVTKRKMHHKSKRKPWISSGIFKSIKTKTKLFKTKLKCPTETNILMYRNYRNKLNHVIRVSKKNYYTRKFTTCKNDLKKTWSSINDVINKNKKRSIYPEYYVRSGVKLTDQGDIANGLNDYFVNVGPSLAQNITSSSSFSDFLHNTSTHTDSSAFAFPITEDEVVEVAYVYVLSVENPLVMMILDPLL